ncbi:S-adenosyl-L-methionine-dependent methyltransferase [Macrolepiota fuliginosa MF-IS2]|uniref:S-adenosyl-L-methionine-dependent methyltransferase n=1 Tax=Macrolepiota fuliginosa MF-IS2 TaxID=1400762 RepID=A0A9P5XQ36_9AGAR|nr:S-adenosyl-L-methionine-dependent methyltransferase [Macrolepiota fuliginosa MF-IS2]
MSDTTSHHHHHHHHSHGHGHGHHHDAVADANREFFNDPEMEFEKYPYVHERAARHVALCFRRAPRLTNARVAKAILKNYPADKEKTVSMDFACGNGLVSRELAPHVKSILGVDVSQRMVEQYNEKLKGEAASAVCIELKGEEDELSGARFDMIWCASAYHHFASVEGITRILASFLKPGGVLIVADIIHLEEEYELPAKHGHSVPHKHGLSKGDMQGAFDAAGLTMKVFEDIPRAAESEDMNLFLAVGEKPSA